MVTAVLLFIKRHTLVQYATINCFIYVILKLSTSSNFGEVYQFALQESSTADTVKNMQIMLVKDPQKVG